MHVNTTEAQCRDICRQLTEKAITADDECDYTSADAFRAARKIVIGVMGEPVEGAPDLEQGDSKQRTVDGLSEALANSYRSMMGWHEKAPPEPKGGVDHNHVLNDFLFEYECWVKTDNADVKDHALAEVCRRLGGKV
jgi:hypothetical protein